MKEYRDLWFAWFDLHCALQRLRTARRLMVTTLVLLALWCVATGILAWSTGSVPVAWGSGATAGVAVTLARLTFSGRD